MSLLFLGSEPSLPGYSQSLVKGLTEKFNQSLQYALKTNDDFRSSLVVREVIWDRVMAVNADHEVNTGGFGASHTRYFDHHAVQCLMAEKLALDWRRLNSR